MLTVEPMSGYDMKRFCELSLAHFWHESYGNLYPRLGRLARAGLIRGRRQRRARGPDAVVYSLTAAGRRVFDAWMIRPPDPDQVRSEFLLKIFFGARTSLELTERRLVEHQRQQRAVRAGYRRVRRLIDDDPGDRPEAPFWRLSLRRGELLTDARLRWCRESLETIRRMRAGARRTEAS